MERRDVFDVTKEPARDLDRYGTHDFGRHCLLARRLLEVGRHVRQGDPLQLRHAQRELRLPPRAGRRVRPVVFGPARRPRPARAARAHARDRDVGVWPHAADQPPLRPRPLERRLVGRAGRGGDQARAWSWARPTRTGTAVVDGQVHAGHLFHTYLRAVGLDPSDSFEVNGRAIQVADPDRLGHQGTAGMTAAPEKTHVVKEFPHKSPLIACRFDRARPLCLCECRRQHGPCAGTWRPGKPPRWPATRAGSLRSRRIPAARRSITGGGDGQIIWWPAAADKPAPLRRVEGHRGWVRALAIEPRRYAHRLVRQRPDDPPLVVRRRRAALETAGP